MNLDKKIIERRLPLSQIYTLISTNYISLIDGCGCTCDNCGKLIANMATVNGGNDNKSYTIGLDCLDTFLINNNLLENKSVAQIAIIKKALPKVIKIRNEVKEFLSKNNFINLVKVEYSSLFNDWITLNYFQDTKQRWNDGYKYKTMDFDLLIMSLQTINANVKFELSAS